MDLISCLTLEEVHAEKMEQQDIEVCKQGEEEGKH